MSTALAVPRPRRASVMPGIRRAGTFVLALAVLAAAAGLMVREIGERPIRSVRIVGEFRHLERADLERTFAPFARHGFFAVDVDELRRAGKRLPWVRDVEVRRVWPDRLDITVHERVAVARWNGDALLEGDGALFKPADPAAAGDLPALSGPKGAHERVLERLGRIEAVLGGAGGGVAKLELRARGAWVAELASGTRIELGREPDEALGERTLRYAVAALGPGGIAAAERVDLRYANGFAVRAGPPAQDQ